MAEGSPNRRSSPAVALSALRIVGVRLDRTQAAGGDYALLPPSQKQSFLRVYIDFLCILNDIGLTTIMDSRLKDLVI